MLRLYVMHKRVGHPKMIFLDKTLAIEGVEEDNLEVEGMKISKVIDKILSHNTNIEIINTTPT